MVTLAQARIIIAALEAAQMALPRGESIWPNKPIEDIAAAADAIITTFPQDARDELIDAFTWGLDG